MDTPMKSEHDLWYGIIYMIVSTQLKDISSHKSKVPHSSIPLVLEISPILELRIYEHFSM